MTKHSPMAVLAAVIMAAAVGCAMQPDSGPDADRGARLFAQECAACHGADAMGAEVGPDLTGLAARNGGVFPRDFVMSTIDGYARGNRHANPMSVFGDGGLGPTVVVEDDDGLGTPVPSDLLALTVFLESVQR
ncbi:MAG: c-type cytochrome [Pseudomonadota bacterium]